MKEHIVRELREKQGDRIFRVLVDIDPIDPRENDNAGTMLCFHKRYQLGDKTDLKSDSFGGWGEIEDYLRKEKKAVIILPLFLYDHSGLHLKVGSFYGLLPQGHAEFDSGPIGYIYITKEGLKREKISKKKAEECLRAEVEEYDQYLSGDVYGFTITKKTKCGSCGHEDEEILDSCSGFFGHNFEKNGLYGAVRETGIDLDKFEEA